MSGQITVEPFTVAVGEQVLMDLRERLRRTRWPRPATEENGWDRGVASHYLRSILEAWATDFDWRRRERDLNLLPHYRANVDGINIHFVHQRGNGPAPLPIVLTHGFPSSFVEHLDLLPLLTDPAAHGGDADDAFDVVVTSLPGFGFSDPLPGPWLEGAVSDLWCRLMRDGLGYSRFGAHGSDIGAGVTMHLGHRHPDQVLGLHLSAFYVEPPPQPWSPAVDQFIARQREDRSEHVAYSRLQSTRPGTVAYGLSDSPAGLAAWILDIFRGFSDGGGTVEPAFTRDCLLTNMTIYWATRSVETAMAPYFDAERYSSPDAHQITVGVPSGFAVFADSYRRGAARPPREIAEHTFTNITHWHEMPRGGHFAALEEPELLARDIRDFFRPLRGAPVADGY